MVLVELEAIHRSFKSYGQAVPVLDGIDLTLDRGDRVAIWGPSGSGKSTLLGVLGLIDTGYEGTYRFDGTDVASLDSQARSQLRLHRVGFALQSPHLLPTLTVTDNLALPALAGGLGKQAARDRARALLDALGLGHRADEHPPVLSGGEKRRASMARALVNRPDVLLLDEPEQGLDPETIEVVLEVLEAEVAKDTAWVMVTHHHRFDGLCNRSVELAQGRLEPLERGAAVEADA